MAQDWRAETCSWEVWLKIHFSNFLIESCVRQYESMYCAVVAFKINIKWRLLRFVLTSKLYVYLLKHFSRSNLTPRFQLPSLCHKRLVIWNIPSRIQEDNQYFLCPLVCLCLLFPHPRCGNNGDEVLTLQFFGRISFWFLYLHCNFYFVIIIIYIVIKFLRLCPCGLLVWISRCFGLSIVVWPACISSNSRSVKEWQQLTSFSLMSEFSLLVWHNGD